MPDTNSPVRWQPERAVQLPPWPVPPLLTALGRGLRCVCPACAQTNIFVGYLTVTPVCSACGAPLGSYRADDAPPYFTIFIVGHVIIGAMFALEQAYQPPFWVHAVIWIPATIILSLLLLRPIKGATVGLMLKLGMMKPADE